MALCLLAFSLLAMEVFFVVTNSDNTDFEAGVPQDMSSGLFNSYVMALSFFKNTLISTLIFSYIALFADSFYKKISIK